MEQFLEILLRILLFRRNHLPAFCPPSVESINGKDADKNHIAERLKANKRAVALYGTPHRRSALSTPVATVVGKGTHPRCSKDHGRRRCRSSARARDRAHNNGAQTVPDKVLRACAGQGPPCRKGISSLRPRMPSAEGKPRRKRRESSFCHGRCRDRVAREGGGTSFVRDSVSLSCLFLWGLPGKECSVRASAFYGVRGGHGLCHRFFLRKSGSCKAIGPS